MLEEKDLEKLQKIIRGRHPELNDEQIKDLSETLAELGLFLVRLRVKQHLNQPESNSKDQ